MTNKTLLRRALAFFLPAIVLATFTAGLGYTLVQQDMRAGANDPQEQLAADAAARLDGGAAPASVVGTSADAASTLAPFVVVFDRAGNALASGGLLDGHAATPPRGVLDAAASSGHNAVTWQPAQGVRLATVVVPWNGGTVMAARSLRLVEDRESNAQLLALAGWLAAVVALAAGSLAAAALWPNRSALSAA